MVISGHEKTRRRGVEFASDQITGSSSNPTGSTGRSAARRSSVVHHGALIDSVRSSVSYELDAPRVSVVSCLVPASVAVAAR